MISPNKMYRFIALAAVIHPASTPGGTWQPSPKVAKDHDDAIGYPADRQFRAL
jgi:hypothetical protein